MCVHVACVMFYTVIDTVFYVPAYYMLLTIYRLLYIVCCIQGEDSELVESEDDEKIAKDPVNGEVNTNGGVLNLPTSNGNKRKQSCHM